MMDSIHLMIGRVHAALTALRRREEGQTLVEYALIIALIAVGLIVALIFLQDEIQELFSDVGNELNKAPGNERRRLSRAGNSHGRPGTPSPGRPSLFDRAPLQTIRERADTRTRNEQRDAASHPEYTRQHRPSGMERP